MPGISRMDFLVYVTIDSMRYLLLCPGTLRTCTEACMETSREAGDYLPFMN